jgi:hypothetical protein
MIRPRRHRAALMDMIACGAMTLQPVGMPALASANQEEATLQRVETDRLFFRDREAATIDVPAASLIAWGRCPPLPLGPHVVLADGGVIAGMLTALDGTKATLESAALGRVELPAAEIAGFRATAASRPTEAEIEEGRGTGADAQARWFILLRNGDRLSARSLRIHEGLIGIDWQGRSVAMPIERVQSITTNTLTAPQPSAAIRVALDDGSRFSLSSPVLAAAVRAADPSLVVAVEGLAATSLARIRPTAIAPQDSIGGRRFAMGSTLAGDWPTVRGLTGFGGISIGASGAPTRILYDVSQPAQRLESTVAIDDSAGQGGRVIVRVVAVSADGSREESLASPVLKGGDEPLLIRAELEGATQIELVVEPVEGERSDAATVWLDPRIIPVK